MSIKLFVVFLHFPPNVIGFSLPSLSLPPFFFLWAVSKKPAFGFIHFLAFFIYICFRSLLLFFLLLALDLICASLVLLVQTLVTVFRSSFPNIALFNDTNFAVGSALMASHRFWYTVFSLSFSSIHALISLQTFSLIYVLFRSFLLIFSYLEKFLLNSLTLVVKIIQVSGAQFYNKSFVHCTFVQVKWEFLDTSLLFLCSLILCTRNALWVTIIFLIHWDLFFRPEYDLPWGMLHMCFIYLFLFCFRL